MAINNIRKELIDLALKEKPDNKIAKILAFYYPNLFSSSLKNLFDNIFYYYKIDNEFDFSKLSQQFEIEDNINKFIGCDFRIKSLEISNLRGIPEKDKDGIPFGMDFCHNGIINNAIILANNGSGKSSIFAGLEMIFAQEIGEKQLRTQNAEGLDKKQYDDYLRRFPDNFKPSCVINTNAGIFNLDDIIFKDKTVRQMFNPSNHFISDFDIYHYGQIEFDGNGENKNSFHSLIANSLGLRDFINLESLLSQLAVIDRRIEKMNLNKLKKQENEAIKNIENWESTVFLKTLELSKIKKKKTKTSVENDSKKKIDKLRELVNRDMTFKLDNVLFEESVTDFTRLYIENQSVEKNQKQVLEKSFLEIGIDLLHDFDNCPFCNDSKKTKDDIKNEVNKRLIELMEFQKNEEELKIKFNNLMNNLLIFYKDNQRVNDILNVERNDISIYNELRTLLEIESDIYVLLSPILDDSELIELVDTLNKTSYPKESDFKKAFDLINNNGNLFLVRYPQIISKVNKFIIDRKSILLDATKNSFIDLPENMNDNLSAVIQEDIIRLKQQVEVSKKMVETLEPQIDAAQKDLDLVDKIKLEVSEFIPIYKTLVNSLVNEAFDPVRDTVETILNDYLKTEKNLSLKIVRKEIISEVEGEKFANNTIVALLEYIDQQTGEKKTITPDLYFNTFRYKLFCLMVSLSLALATRRKYEINLPLIMDDLFYASDFINKHSFSKFIIQVINLFYKYTPNLPLQFVIFTHDDLIFKSAIDSLSVKCS